MSSAAKWPACSPSRVRRTDTTLSTMSQERSRRPFSALGWTADRIKDASTGSVVHKHSVTESVPVRMLPAHHSFACGHRRASRASTPATRPAAVRTRTARPTTKAASLLTSTTDVPSSRK